VREQVDHDADEVVTGELDADHQLPFRDDPQRYDRPARTGQGTAVGLDEVTGVQHRPDRLGDRPAGEAEQLRYLGTGDGTPGQHRDEDPGGGRVAIEPQAAVLEGALYRGHGDHYGDS